MRSDEGKEVDFAILVYFEKLLGQKAGGRAVRMAKGSDEDGEARTLRRTYLKSRCAVGRQAVVGQGSGKYFEAKQIVVKENQDKQEDEYVVNAQVTQFINPTPVNKI